MAAELGVAGVRIGLSTPLVLVLLPLLAVPIWYLVTRGRSEGVFDRRGRRVLVTTRVLLVALLVLAAAGPYTVSAQQVTGEPSVTMLVDRSASMAVTEDVSGDLAAAIEERGVRVRTRVVGSGTRSRIGDGIASAVTENGSVLVVSDGRVTGGRSLAAAANLAGSVNASVSAVNLTAARTERYVRVRGPAKTSTGVGNTFLVEVGGVERSGGPVQLTISVDGEQIRQERVTGTDAIEFTYEFAETGSHRITARIETSDTYDSNDVYRTTVRAVEPPRVLYVARGDYPFEDFLRELYRVDRVQSIPANLSGYYAVVVQDVAAEDLGNVTALQRAVIDGTGLVAVGGNNAFEHGNYEESLYTSMLPVSVGVGNRNSRIVLAVDVSGSTQQSLSLQQALALNVLDQLGGQNQVGLVAFNQDAFRVANLSRLSTSRERLSSLVRRLRSAGSTDVSAGLRGSRQLLGDGAGTVILLTDGFDRGENAPMVARQLASEGVRVVPIGVGQRVQRDYLQRIAEAGDGTYLRADQTSRLRLLFGGEDRQYSGSGLTVIDDSHFITSGLTLRSTPAESHAVSVADRADYLAIGANGNPALSAWRYGLGRTVAVTAYGADGTLDGLLSEPDSLALSRSVNWVVGDPERLETNVTEVGDARVGQPTTVVHEGSARPRVEGASFTRVAENTYRATLVPGEPGYESVLGAEYAVNYPAEYGGFGPAPALEAAVDATGGEVFEPDEAARIATAAKQRATRIEDVTTHWRWLALVAALVVFLAEVAFRRLHRITAPP